MKRSMKAGLLATLAVASMAMVSSTASARDNVSWSVSIGAPYAQGYAPGVVYTQQPVYVQPQPVYVQPAPVYVRPYPVVQYQSYYADPYPRYYHGGRGHHRGHGYGHGNGHHHGHR